VYRSVALPESVTGSLYLGSMPGRYEVFEAAWHAIVERDIARVICLVPVDELEDKSPHYARAIHEQRIPWQHQSFPVGDFDAPDDREGFWELAQDVAVSLVQGETILVHCAGGIGRTGMFSICVLIALGVPAELARTETRRVGSAPENAAQDEVVDWVAALKGEP